MKLNAALRLKLEEILDAYQYRIRYEKGNFQGGVCLLEDQRVVVVNKFYPMEGQVNTLIEITLQVVATVAAPTTPLTDDQLKLLDKLRNLQAEHAQLILALP
jgi:hypothetical protein